MKHTCTPVGLDFLEDAPRQIVTRTRLDASCAAVFSLLGDAEQWPLWFEEMQEVTWTTPTPRAEGAQRIVRLTSVVAEERFLVWEEPTRFAFRFERTNRPLFAAFMEDYQLTPSGNDACTLTWIAAWKSSWLTWLVAPIVHRQLTDMFERAAADLKEYVARTQPPHHEEE